MPKPHPTFDIEGHDAGHKITIMSALAFGTPVNFDACYLEGIRSSTAATLNMPKSWGYRIKLLGITRKSARASNCACTPR